jgi:hypothetical protein
VRIVTFIAEVRQGGSGVGAGVGPMQPPTVVVSKR